MNRYVTVVVDTAGNEYVTEWDKERTAPVRTWKKVVLPSGHTARIVRHSAYGYTVVWS